MKKVLFCLLVIGLLFGVSGCGKGASVEPTVTYQPGYSQSGYPMTTTTVLNIPPATEVKESSGFWDFGGGKEQIPEYDVIIAPAPTTTITTTTASGDGYSSGVYAIPAERMVIKNASMALVVEDINASLKQIANLASVNGGYVVNSDIREDKSRLYGNISFRVSADKFDQTLQALRDLAVDIRSETTSGQDVTEEYVDLEARLRNLEASEAQLLVLMERAGEVDDILKVQKELTNTRQQIEQIKGRMQYLQQSAALSSIYVTLEQSTLSVEFFATMTTVKEGEKVQFVPTISGGFSPYSFEWNFGDGETSTEGAPFHVYKKDGTYTVNLLIKDDKGGTANAERKDYITVTSAWEAGSIAGGAWNGLVGFGRFLGSFFIWLGVLSPIWIVILVILYFAWWRRRKKKA